MRGKVTADAYSGGWRVGDFTWCDDDWEVTRPRVTTAHQG
jgi:hypothetical protein